MGKEERGGRKEDKMGRTGGKGRERKGKKGRGKRACKHFPLIRACYLNKTHVKLL